MCKMHLYGSHIFHIQKTRSGVEDPEGIYDYNDTKQHTRAGSSQETLDTNASRQPACPAPGLLDTKGGG